ncbi:sialate O-acetylesterase [Candidatus Neomarinimicrobiota bacterium]
MINISGTVDSAGYDSIYVNLLRNNEIYSQDTLELVFVESTAEFHFSPIINAELAEYSINIYVDTILVAERNNIVSGDVYLINGQSNAVAEDFEGKETFQSKWIRSFGTSSNSASECAADTSWGLAQGATIYSHTAIGVCGMQLAKNITEGYGIPICILNGAVRGAPIEHHNRDHSNHSNLNTIYGRLLYRVQKAGITNAIKAIFWYQGESDTDLSHLTYINDFGGVRWAWHQNYPKLEKIYVFQIRPSKTDCGFGYQSELREMQRQLRESYSDVKLMSTSGINGHYSDGCHYYYEGYKNMANWIFPLVARNYYGSTDKDGINSPNIINAYQSGGEQKEITLIFDQPVFWPEPYQGYKMEDYFYIGDQIGTVSSGHVEDGNKIILELNSPPSSGYVTYLPEDNYNGTNEYYKGPWIKNSRGLGILSFYQFPMDLYSPPKGGNDEITTFEDQEYYFKNNDFQFSDVDGQEFSGIIIESLPSKGMLNYNGEPVEIGFHYTEMNSLTYMNDQDEYGDSYTTFNFRVVDGSHASSENVYTMTIHVTELNDPPTIDSISDFTILEDSGEFEILLQGIGKGPDPSEQVIAITAWSPDIAAFPHPVVEYNYPDQAAILTSTLSSNVYGIFPIEITLRDDGGIENGGVDSLVTTFDLLITGVNDAPTFNAIADVEIQEDSGHLTMQIDGIDPGIFEEDQRIILAAVSSNDTVIPNPIIIYDGISSTADIVISTVLNANGTAIITVSAKDNGGVTNSGTDSFNRTFIINITPVNDGPNGFALLEPLEEIDLVIAKNNLQDTLIFSWESTDDPDQDSVTYNFVVTGDLASLSRENIISEELKISYSELVTNTDTINVANGSWTIVATDKDLNTTAVNGPFNLSIDSRSLITGLFSLDQNFPNPFNGKTRIGYDLPTRIHVKLTIYNLLGREVKTLVDEIQSKGYKSVTWDGLNNFNEHVGSGLYLYVIQAGDKMEANKLIYMK